MTRRLVLSYLVVTLVVLVLLEVPLAIFFQQRELDRLTANVERDATVLASIYEEALEHQAPIDPTPSDDYAGRTGARVVVVDEDGISVADTEAAIDRNFATRPEFAVALAGDRATGTRRSDTLDTELLYVAVPVASGGVVHGALRLTLDTHEVTERIYRFWIGLVAIAVVVLLVMWGVGFAIARSVTRPIRRLQLAADRFSSGDLTPTTPDPGTPAELAALEAAMNTMAGDLDELILRQRAFVADASHQLRTPLTALRLRLENLESSATDESSSEELATAIGETERLGLLVGDLLHLARAERESSPVATDLAQLVRDRVDLWGASAELVGVEIDLESPADTTVEVYATPGGIEQMLDNLLDNAIRAAPDGTAVTVTVATGQADHQVSVADRGHGLSDLDKERALDRFWRGDTSTPGTGLGLPIVRAIVESGGGTIDLSDNRPSGLVATVRLRTVGERAGEADAVSPSRR